MATINQRSIVDNIIANDGYYEEDGERDDMRVVRIVQYNNMFNGGLAYGLIYEGEDKRRYFQPQCHNPVVIFDVEED